MVCVSVVQNGGCLGTLEAALHQEQPFDPSSTQLSAILNGTMSPLIPPLHENAKN